MDYETNAIQSLAAKQAIVEVLSYDVRNLKPWKNGVLLYFPATENLKEYWLSIKFGSDAMVSCLPDQYDNVIECTTWSFEDDWGFRELSEDILYVNNTKMGIRGYATEVIEKVIKDLEIPNAQVCGMQLIKTFEI